MFQNNGIMGEYILIKQQNFGIIPFRRFDISKIDFDQLRREIAKAKKKNLSICDVEELIQFRLDVMLKTHPRRIDYYERYTAIINEYNSELGRVTIKKTFIELMDISNSMTKEEQRYVREVFESDEALTLYDILFTDNLSKEDIHAIKKVAIDLLKKIKDKRPLVR